MRAPGHRRHRRNLGRHCPLRHGLGKLPEKLSTQFGYWALGSPPCPLFSFAHAVLSKTRGEAGVFRAATTPRLDGIH
jgi:hypothetical protein